jgi:hypothetical protein
VWTYTSVIPALRRLRWEDHEFKASLELVEWLKWWIKPSKSKALSSNASMPPLAQKEASLGYREKPCVIKTKGKNKNNQNKERKKKKERKRDNWR